METDHRTLEEEDEKIKKLRSIVGPEVPESDIINALLLFRCDPDAAAEFLVKYPGLVTVKRTITSTGARISTQIGREEDSQELEKETVNVASRMPFDQFLRVTEEYLGSQAMEEPDIKPSGFDESRCEPNAMIQVKEETNAPQVEEGLNAAEKAAVPIGGVAVNKGRVALRISFKEFLKVTDTKVMTTEEYLSSQENGEQEIKQAEIKESQCESNTIIRVKEKPDVPQFEGLNAEEKQEEPRGGVVANKVTITSRMSFEDFLKVTSTKVMTTEEHLRSQAMEQPESKHSEIKEYRCGFKDWVRVKEEPDVGFEAKGLNGRAKSVDKGLGALEKEEAPKGSTEANLCKQKDKPAVASGSKVPCEILNAQVKQEAPIEAVPISWAQAIVPVEGEPIDVDPINCAKPNVTVNQEPDLGVGQKSLVVTEEPVKEITRESFIKKFNRIPVKRVQSSQSSSDAKKRRNEDQKPCHILVEDGDFPEEPDWFLVGRTMVTALSTTKGMKLADNEIVHFSPSTDWRSNSHWIIRFSTKRYGEIGRLPMEWGKCVVPLVNSGKVKFYGRCIAAPPYLSIMQDIMLYVSFFIHRSIFTDDVNSSWGWKLEAVHIDSTIYPLLTLFKLLKIKPYQKAEFTPEELDSRKRLLNLGAEPNEAELMLPIVKRRKGCQQYPEQGKEEQAVSQSSLDKLVGAVDACHLQVVEPPSTLTCNLRTYQKEALHWMSELEKGIDVEKATKTLHPCWAAYRISDERAFSIYVNLFSGEATTRLPTAAQMARGGILADAMGLGKTVMTIALILKSPCRASPDNQGPVKNATESTEIMRKESRMDASSKPKGSTLIICPMALLSQWKDELETHSEQGCISIFVHYGGGRAHNPEEIAEHDVVLTTYGVLSNAYKSEGEDSIFHRVDWYRVVLDEAHTIKCWKSQGARASFTLSSHCRWCLTGTPIQNNLEDLYSLLCFLHVEPWCNWAWWNKLIQKPYENGDPRGLRLIKAILRPLMLRRTKESQDKEGRPILVLPPTDIQIIECEMTEAEQDFYDALFRRSKVQFDQFVAEGKVLHNYANILELLLRLRQCCNHPFLVMSRADSQKYADLNKLARRFFEANPESASTPNAPTKAYIEEVVEGIRRGQSSECPICMESADDPVLTPCAHRMCRECLLSSWRSLKGGLCPLCRQMIWKTDLITCPSESRFHVDVEKNWKESSKISSLLDCLEQIRHSGSGEKSIVFSQWTTFMDLLEIPLKREGIGYLRYDGGLTQKQRERVLYEFNETKVKTVLLMSLRAGGVGLNLTAASNVFLMDPWWNPAVEEQAIMRIHRIGQKRTVSVRRFIVKDTVEERMQQVQFRKQKMIAGALTDEEVRSARIEELKMLFR